MRQRPANSVIISEAMRYVQFNEKLSYNTRKLILWEKARSAACVHLSYVYIAQLIGRICLTQL